MFGWFKRKSRDGGRLAQLAFASAERRARLHKTSEDDTNALLEHALRLATFFLEGGQLPTFLSVREGFPPFGAGINPSGEVVEIVPIASDDPIITNICFGGEDLRTAYVTAAGRGRLYRGEWKRPGLALNL